VRDQGLTDRDEIPVGTAAGAIRLYLEPDGQVRVDMGMPEFRPAHIPFRAASETADATYPLAVEGQTLTIGALSMGNPHAVLIVEEIDSAPVAHLGPLIERHPDFPARVNVGFMQVLSPTEIRLRVYERGVGETLACGTGACAAVVSGRRRGWLSERVRVALPGGELMVEWAGPGHPVWMTGPAVRVFEGEIER
jgi:diaminopimelate epimerase (EC 5.1.1.7)